MRLANGPLFAVGSRGRTQAPMVNNRPGDFLAGVIEGFYGEPWTQIERLQLFDWMAGWGLNTYLYCPKDDLKHRAVWRELYSASETEPFAASIRACGERNIRFIYALAPGLDIRYRDDSEIDRLIARFEQMRGLGCEDFAVLFDDIPERMAPEDLVRWGSLASAQCQAANAVFSRIRERCPKGRFLFCPTAYCGRMAEHKLGGEGYLPTVGRELAPGIDVLWTGPEIISREISVAHARDVGAVLRRKPLIWDNLHANDYDGRRFFCGPYAGRPPELRNEVSGLLSNPNNEFSLNYVPLRTLGEFVRCEGGWDARKAALSAIWEWLPQFATIRDPICFEDLVLFCDCYFLPYEEGPEAEALYQRAKALLSAEPSEFEVKAAELLRQTRRLARLCASLAELRDRRLFYALSRRIWELREEMDLLERYVQFKTDNAHAEAKFNSDFHLPGTYRGGMTARLQRLFIQQPDGSLTPAQEAAGVRTNNV